MFYLKRNLPQWERVARLLLALAVGLSTFYLAAGAVAWLGWLTAATLALTAIGGFCPACALVGRRSIGR